MLSKIELIGKYLGFGGAVHRDSIFNWVKENKALTLIMTKSRLPDDASENIVQSRSDVIRFGWHHC